MLFLKKLFSLWCTKMCLRSTIGEDRSNRHRLLNIYRAIEITPELVIEEINVKLILIINKCYYLKNTYCINKSNLKLKVNNFLLRALD